MKPMKTLTCVFQGCKMPNRAVLDRNAYVPEGPVMSRKLGGRAVTVQDLAQFVHCPDDALRLRDEAAKAGVNLPFLPYSQVRKALASREAEEVRQRLEREKESQALGTHLGDLLRAAAG